MRVLAAVTITLLLAAATARAANYGGNPPAEQHRMVNLILGRFGDGWFGRAMVCIARRESGLNPRAVNYGGGSYGLFQLNYASHRWLNLRRVYDPVYNVQAAWIISGHGRSLRPWGGGC